MSSKPSGKATGMWRGWWLAWFVATIAIVIEGAVTRFTLPQLPLVTPDSYLYLLPAVNGGEYAIGPRSLVYPMFCREVVSIWGGADLRSITVVQHVLGLLGPILMLAAWCRMGAEAWTRPSARCVHAAVGLALVLLLVPSGVSLIYEQQTMLESISGFLQCVLAASLCVLWLPGATVRGSLWSCWVAGLGVFMYYANPRWGGGAPAVVMLAVIAAVVGRDSQRSRLRASWPSVATAVGVYLTLWQIQTRIVSPDPWNGTFTAKHLLWLHADLAANEFHHDLDAPVAPVDAPLLRALVERIDRAMVGYGASGWPGLPFNADVMINRPDNPDAHLLASFAGDPEGYRRFCLRTFRRILLHQPRAYLNKVGRVLLFYYSGPPDDGAFREIAAPLSDVLSVGSPIIRALAEKAQPPHRAALLAAAEQAETKGGPSAIQPPAWLWTTVRWARTSFLTLTLLGAATSVAVLSWRRGCAHIGLRVLASVCLGAIGVLLAQVLTLAAVTITAGRYADALRPLASFTLVASVSMIGAFGVVWFKFATAPATQNL